MFVKQSTYDNLVSRNRRLERQLAQRHYDLAILVKKWNDLVDRVNARGGEDFLDSEPEQQFTGDELKVLISLCHPDKHGGKAIATEMTQKLIELRVSS